MPKPYQQKNAKFWTFHDYVDYVNDTKSDPIAKNWRLGQTYFNCLYEVRPNLADAIRGGPYDPFHSTHPSKLGAFLKLAEANWNKDLSAENEDQTKD